MELIDGVRKASAIPQRIRAMIAKKKCFAARRGNIILLIIVINSAVATVHLPFKRSACGPITNIKSEPIFWAHNIMPEIVKK